MCVSDISVDQSLSLCVQCAVLVSVCVAGPAPAKLNWGGYE